MTTSPRALVVKLSSLGDLFHALPAVHALKKGMGLTIDWVTQPEYAPLVGCFDDVDRVLTFPRRRFFRSLPAFLKDLREETYDYVFDFQGLIKSGLTTRLARGRERIGPSYAREGASVFYHEIAGKPDKNRHAVEEGLDFVRHFGLDLHRRVFPVTFPEPSVPLADDAPRIAYLPCSRWQTKNWPPSHFAQLIRILHGEIGGTAYLLGGKEDVHTCAAIERDASVPVQNVCGQTSLIELGGLLKEMDLVVSVDSGPMHMASAVGVSVLAIFGATDPKRTGPYGHGHHVVQHGGLDCQPCRSRQCLRPQKDIACMRDLSPERVAEKVVALVVG